MTEIEAETTAAAGNIECLSSTMGFQPMRGPCLGGQEACLGMLRAPCSWGEKEEPRVRAQVDRDANEMMDARVRARAERRARMRARLGNLGTLIEQRDAAEMRAKCMENRVRAQVEREIAKALSDDADFRLRNRASDAHADTRALARHGILKAWSAWILNSDYETRLREEAARKLQEADEIDAELLKTGGENAS